MQNGFWYTRDRMHHIPRRQQLAREFDIANVPNGKCMQPVRMNGQYLEYANEMQK